MSIAYTSEEPTTMAMQAALAAIDGYLSDNPSDDDMAEAYDRLQAALSEGD